MTIWRGGGSKIYKQTIRTFYGVREGAVRILHTDPVLHPRVRQKSGKGGGRHAEGGAEHGAENGVQA